MIKVYIHTPTIRLKDALKFAGAAENGGQAKTLIKEEKVRVNGEICSISGKQLLIGDTFSLDGLDYIITHDFSAQ